MLDTISAHGVTSVAHYGLSKEMLNDIALILQSF